MSKKSKEINTMNPNEISSFNYYTLMIIGLFFEIFGALFLSMESIGIQSFTNFYKFIYKMSKWAKESIYRMLVLSSPFIILIAIGIFMNDKTLLSLMIPISIISMLFSTIIDHPWFIENYIVNKTQDKKIGPIGFFIMIIGFLFQLTSVIWQMSRTV